MHHHIETGKCPLYRRTVAQVEVHGCPHHSPAAARGERLRNCGGLLCRNHPAAAAIQARAGRPVPRLVVSDVEAERSDDRDSWADRGLEPSEQVGQQRA